MKKLITYIFLLLILSSPGWAATTTLYICPNGSGVGDGSSWAQCDDGIDDLNALDPTTGNDIVIYFGDSAGDPAVFESNAIDFASWTGSYPTVTINGNGSTFSGNSDRVIFLDDSAAAWSITTVYVNDSTGLIAYDHDGIIGAEFIHIEDVTNAYVSYVTINGHTNATETATGTRGIEIYNTTYAETTYNNLQNLGPNPIAYAEMYGIQVYNVTRYVIDNNTIHDIGADGIDIAISGSDAEQSSIANNTIYDCYEEGIDVKGHGYVNVQYNKIYRSGDLSDADALIQLLSDDSEWGGYNNINSIVRWNYLHGDVEHYAIQAGGAGSTNTVNNADIYENYISGCKGAIHFRYQVNTINFYNNVILNTSGADSDGIIRFESTGANLKVYSNSIYSDENTYAVHIETGYSAATTVVEANAIDMDHASAYAYYDENGSAKFTPDWNTWVSAGDEVYINGGVDGALANNYYEDPQFVTPGTDLSLSESSNARGNAGGSNESTNGLKSTSTWTPSFSIETVARNGSPDAGAYEYVESAQQQPPKAIEGLNLY